MVAKTASKKQVENKHGVQVGEFFVSSWGYDQTNVDFYKVVKVTPSGVYVQKWTTGSVSDPYAPQVDVVAGGGPAKGAYVYDKEKGYSEYHRDAEAPVKFHRTQVGYGGRVYFTVNSFSSAHQWDGKPEYQTGVGWGH